MQREPFDPAAWLQRWKAAGGGWAAGHLIRSAGDNPELRALARELDLDRREAVADHLRMGGGRR